MKFVSKRIEIEAVQFDGGNYAELADFTDDQFWYVEIANRIDDPDIMAEVYDKLHSTWVGVKAGQWIIKGTKGEFYPCDPEVFEAKYEQI